MNRRYVRAPLRVFEHTVSCVISRRLMNDGPHAHIERLVSVEGSSGTLSFTRLRNFYMWRSFQKVNGASASDSLLLRPTTNDTFIKRRR